MTEEIFYQYDFYTLEQKYAENEFIKILDNEPSLDSVIDSFIKDVVGLLFTSIKDKDPKSIEISTIQLPQIETELERILKGNFFYDIYFESNSENKLSEVVLNKFLNRVFRKDGFNDEKFIIQGYIHAWLEKRLAMGIVKDPRFSSVAKLTSLIGKTEMLHRFYTYLVKNIPQDWILDNRKDWVNISVSPERFLDSIRTFDKGYFHHYIELLDSTDKSDLWDYTLAATRGSDYAMLNQEFSFRSSVLITNNKLLWIEFWSNLKLPVIQDCVFHSFLYFKPQQYLRLVNALVSGKIILESDLNVLLLILAKNYFDASYRLTERLAFYDNEDKITPENRALFKEGQVYYKKWLEEKKIYYKNFIEDLHTHLNQNDIENWIFNYKPRINNSPTYKPNEIYNSEIELLTSIYKSYYNQSTDFDLQSFNLQKFNFYVGILKESEDKKFGSNLLEAIINFISSDKFHWDKTYAEPYLSALKGLGFLLSQQKNSILRAKELINKFKVIHQGWNPSKIGFAPLVKESFIYSGVALLFENDRAFKKDSDKEQFFKVLLNHILMQDRYSQIDNSEYYQMPLHLLFLVVNQMFTEVKEYYERELIYNYDNLYSLLAILSSDEEPICDNSKTLMKERLDKEFLLEKRQFSNRSQKDKVLELENMIEALNLGK